MQIVIDISDSFYDRLVHMNIDSDTCSFNESALVEFIQNGTPLPKGHGDLIDISKLPVTTTYFGISDKPVEVVNYNCILNAKKVIKADKIQNNKVENKK